MSEVFGCCSSYIKCSDERQCIHKDDEIYAGCQYRKNLEAGNIFYGKNAGKPVPDVHISVKSKNWWSYPVKDNAERNSIIDILIGAGVINIPVFSGFCGSRVLFDYKDKTYVLQSPGPKMITKEAAYNIQEKLTKLFPSRVEILAVGTVHQENNYTYQADKTIAVKQNLDESRKTLKPLPKHKPFSDKYIQVSIFDLTG